MSSITTFADKVCELIVNETGCKYAIKGIGKFASEQLPVAQIALDDGIIIFNNINNTYDINMKLYVMVDGNSFEEVQTILENLVTLFLVEPAHQDMIKLGAIELAPERMLPAINFEGNIAFWRGAVHFGFDYRVVF